MEVHPPERNESAFPVMLELINRHFDQGEAWFAQGLKDCGQDTLTQPAGLEHLGDVMEMDAGVLRITIMVRLLQIKGPLHHGAGLNHEKLRCADTVSAVDDER